MSKKKSTIDDINYIVCPDFDCKVWEQKGIITKLCSENCKGEPDLYIICHSCGKKILVGIKHCSWLRVDCECGACNFQRMSGKYHRVKE